MTSNSKRKRSVLNIEKKFDILNRLATGESGARIAYFYNVGKSTISDINKSRESILNFLSKLDSEDGLKKKENNEGSKRCCSTSCALFVVFTKKEQTGPDIGPSVVRKSSGT
ncbi:jerky-like protein [Trichonephila clavipes]|nr:jerky-like protein [Trichonephila clavipes]